MRIKRDTPSGATMLGATALGTRLKAAPASTLKATLGMVLGKAKTETKHETASCGDTTNARMTKLGLTAAGRERARAECLILVETHHLMAEQPTAKMRTGD